MRHMTSRLAVTLVMLAALIGAKFTGAYAQIPTAEPASGRGQARVNAVLDPALLAALKWRSIGPTNTGGRVADFAVARVPGAPDALYVGTASGGVFKSTNAGVSWTPIFDKVDAMMSVGDIAVAPSNPNIVWVGTGEANNRQSSSWGDGVYKSVDGGRTWKDMGLKQSGHTGRIVVHPTDPDIVYVAAVGHLWGSNPERGLFKTTDGGNSWKKILYVDENTGANDVALDPQDPQTLFASTYQRQRKGWGYNGGGPGSALYRSYNGGATWTQLTNGLPRGEKGRIGLDIFRGDGRIVSAIVEAAAPLGGRGGRGGRGGGGGAAANAAQGEGGVFRSTDHGDTWEHLSSLNPRPSYYSQIRIDPKDSERVYIMGSSRGLYISDDGGKTFREIFTDVHGEDHALWIDPDDPNHLLLGGDGGVSISWDRGLTWLFRNNFPIGQFYEIGVDMKEPYTVCGGLQDNGVWCVPSATQNRNGISNADVRNVGCCDGFHALIDPKDPTTAFLTWQSGKILRVNLTTLERQSITPSPIAKPKPGEAGYRWNWDSPIVLSSFDPATVYLGANVLFKSTDRGMNWKVISPDLTARLDRDSLTMMGGRITAQSLSRNDGQSTYSTLTAIGESPRDARVLYTGSDDGQLQVTRDDGASWTNLTAHIPGLPRGTYVSGLEASRHAAGRVYATFDGHFDDDYRPYVYVSEDYGQTWRSRSAGLPEASVNRIREHPTNPRVLVVGHSRGVHLSNDGGASWLSLATNMPTVPVADLIIHPRDNALIVGTHGRGIWILDDLAPLEALTADVVRSDAHVMPIPRARLWSIWWPQAWFGAGEFFAPNPDYGAVITYYLREAAAGPVQLEVSDAAGHRIRTLPGPANRGLNRAVWDLRLESPLQEPSTQEEVMGGYGGPPRAPLVLPGRYAVTVRVPGITRELRGDVTVEGDPRTVFAAADRRARQGALLNLYELQKTLDGARVTMRTLAGQADAIRKVLVGDGPAPRAAAVGLGALDTAAARITQVQADINRQASAVNALSRAIESFASLPTADQQRELDWAFEDATQTVEDVNRLLQREMPALYTDLMKQETWPRRLPPVTAPVRRP